MAKHPHILSAEIDLLNAQRAEIDAKNAAEEAMRVWAFHARNLGAAESRIHYLRRFLENGR
jgi:hypothetical protein